MRLLWLWQVCSGAARCFAVHLGRELCVLGCEERSRNTTQLHSVHVIGMCITTVVQPGLVKGLRQNLQFWRRLRRADFHCRLDWEDGIQNDKHE